MQKRKKPQEVSCLVVYGASSSFLSVLENKNNRENAFCASAATKRIIKVRLNCMIRWLKASFSLNLYSTVPRKNVQVRRP